MATAQGPAGAARAAVNAAAILTRELEQRLLAPAVEAVASDGRKQRWARHKEERRAELIVGTIDAVRELGPDCGMDEIARSLGVSKTVLYRYFADKNDLAAAVTESFIQVTLLPRLTETLTEELDDYELVRAVISVYVHTVDAEPNVYRYCLHSENGRHSVAAAAAAHRIFTESIESTLRSRLAARDAETAGSRTWALAIVGSVEQSVDRWLTEQWVTADRLIDELAMLVWGGVVAVVNARGSTDVFTAAPPTIPPIPPDRAVANP
ncbi:TetR/AcrR family transcriptional regulator [Gordonia hirsuta]|nr:TetR/AcrR family transcriptional regulator [Gordonia hirsuta]